MATEASEQPFASQPEGDARVGKTLSLPIARFGSPGAFLTFEAEVRPDAKDVVLLPGNEIPEGATEGDVLEVFLYRDSEDRMVATRMLPKVRPGEIAFLEVKDVTGIGAFVGWGLAKDLLVPFAEQTREVSVGERHPISPFVDNSGRLAGTMRVTELLKSVPDVAVGDWVEGEAWRKESEIGVFVIFSKRFVGLVPKHEPNRLVRGEAARFRVARILADGKCELSLRGLAYEQRDGDAERILTFLEKEGAPRVSESDAPDLIHRRFALSKKAFKRAVGLLLRQGKIAIDDDGTVRAKPSRS